MTGNEGFVQHTQQVRSLGQRVYLYYHPPSLFVKKGTPLVLKVHF